jgi:hypothetical protein
MKQCRKCLELKELSGFYKCKTNKDGLRGSCKICMGSYCDSYNSKNEDIVIEYKRKYYNKNKQTLLQNVKEDRKINPAKYSKHTKKWKSLNKEKVAASSRKRRELDPDKYRRADQKNRVKNKGTKNSVNARRRAAKLKATLSVNEYKKDIKKIYDNCPDGYHVDHIIPLQGKEVCGLHVPWNLQYLSAEENIKKGNRICQE